ncbi:uncharacterized protein LOC115620030 [Scaptodrosophila lebanonensis]|uniref:Uncharacterized protein LOC115620030 n=1 Tax=Drosophila lebanonensis TaxID=7225 RepID=A0A6J2T162_DROLE|nr:uncharacterized protein LOC115620030 [Scaptodrosophila lebanonensis]
METLPCTNEVQLNEAEAQQLVNLSHMEASISMGDNVVTISKELILISLVSQEQLLYNPKHQHYRSTQRKDEKWNEIGCHVGWTDAQCKAKWKAMRDQYCRELKRAKASAKVNVKWKYFKELDFLRPFALARNYRTHASNDNVVCTASSTLPSVSTALGNNNSHSFSSNSSSQTLTLGGDTHKFANIKMEGASAALLEDCNFVPSTTVVATSAPVTTATVADKKTESTRLMHALIAGQISNAMQQQQTQGQQNNNWDYLSEASTNGVVAATAARDTPNTTAEDTLYNDFVDCVNAAATNHSSHNQPTVDEEDEDPIHTFLNMESYFEKELITLIQQEDMIYNYSNQNYRNVKLKLAVWDEIARKLKKPVKQCRQKWKALRDQYAREHKRLKTLTNVDTHSRWKHYDSLNFLQKFIQQKSLDSEAQLNLLLPKHEPASDMEEHMASHSPLRTEAQQTLAESPVPAQLNISSLPQLSGPHSKVDLGNALEQHDQANELCVTSYDEMDIENYINGDVAHNEDEDEEDEDMEPVTSADQQQQQQQHVVSYQETEDEHVYISVQDVSNTLGKAVNSQTPEPLNDGSNLEQQQQHQQRESAAVAAADFQQKQEVHTPTSTSSRYQNAATPTNSHAAFPLGCINSSMNDDDEIGAFFKAVAMKIRSAQLDPVAFTDLQINILRAINEALRHH